MHKIYSLKDRLCEELESYGSRDKLDASDIEIIDTLAYTIKNIDKIIAVYEEDEYRAADRNRYSYEASRMAYPWNIMDRGGSYARGRGRSYYRSSGDRNSYDESYRRSRNDGYSRAEEDMDSMINELKGMMHDLPSEKQHEVQKFIQRIEQM